MKLIFYNDENRVLDIQENMQQVTISENEVTWQDGSVKGIKVHFIVLPDEVDVGDTVTEEIMSKDVKDNFKKRDLEQENAELRARLDTAEMALITVMDLM